MGKTIYANSFAMPAFDAILAVSLVLNSTLSKDPDMFNGFNPLDISSNNRASNSKIAKELLESFSNIHINFSNPMGTSVSNL